MTAVPFPYEGPADLADPIVAALRRVVDPELALDIVDIGLVVGVALRGQELQVQVTMTSAACPVGDAILEDIGHELGRAVPADVAVRVELVWEPAWTPERLSEGARRFMGW